jgi:hypothetical protein
LKSLEPGIGFIGDEINQRPLVLAKSCGITMKAISASIVVLAAAILIVGGSHVKHVDTQLFVQIVGCGVGVIGLWGWFVSFKEK